MMTSPSSSARRHDMPFGAMVLEGGGVRFRLWAPSQPTIGLRLSDAGQTLPMQATEGGWHELVVPEAKAGTRYAFMLPDGLAVPDPASRFNPDDVHKASMVVDPMAHAWQDVQWRGRPWHEAVVYELHIGTFTDAGTYNAAAERLPELAALGITAVELMPLADFPGRRGWGYDGVLPFAPDASYGTPQDLKRLIETAHGLGLMVLLDVVYNHFGPEGNYLHAFCPEFFNPAHRTPWGAAINFDGPNHRVVRDFFIHNALYWVEEYRFDGLRLDAVHAIRDDSALHICREIAEALRNGPGRERHVHLVLENEDNIASLLERDGESCPKWADAQWNDDLHHAAHVLATGETDGYYADYADHPLERLGRALAEGFIYQGEPSPLRGGELRGEPSSQLPGPAFVSFLQNHDQIGNRAFGDRISALAQDRSRLDALYACLLLSPHVPMLFMGEEFAASTPFLYFCDFGPELAQAVSTGRREEFKRFAAFQDPAKRESIPDPNDEFTFRASKLRWSERHEASHGERFTLIQELLAARRQWITPRLPGMRRGGGFDVESGLLHVRWTLGDGSTLRLAAHFGDDPVQLPHDGHIVFARLVHGRTLHSGSVAVTLEEGTPS